MTSPSATEIAFGVAGWSYPDWKGYVYNPGEKDALGFVARHVDMIEINSTFYRPPEARLSASWVQRTAFRPGFFFSAKLHQEITHQGLLEEGMKKAFREGLAPLVEAGRLHQVLAQFRYDFRDHQTARELLSGIADFARDWVDVVVEVRHVSWQEPEALQFLAGLGVSVANLDYPMSRDSFNLPVCRVGDHGYFRLHGRNRKAWFDKEAGRGETYNYFYTLKELSEIKDRVVKIAKARKSMTVVGNNHYQGKELGNILQLKSLVTGQKVPVPERLLEHYPELAEIAEPPPPDSSQEGRYVGTLF
ncbi:MAG TPA: hypothetical protein DCZ95_04715 [Verrucomicrobia bacterium]|nr:MAG: hypothetical protein A2X46_14620 [Lentisphaerae bacterium GWF2_57_35]HBA83380.1 hypothetical protein [Verrucomicrobiota bacterium]